MIDNKMFGVNEEEVADTSKNEFDSQFDNAEPEEEGENNPEVAEPEEGSDDGVDVESEDESDGESEEESTDTNKGQSPEERSKYAAARREAEAQAKALKERQDNFAKKFGYNTFDEMEQAEKQQAYVSQGYDENMANKLVQVDEMMAQMQEQKNRTRIAEEKVNLSSKPFFKELESDVDAILEQQPNLPVELVFNVVKGEKMEELMKNNKNTVRQKVLNSLESKSHVKPDGKGKDADLLHVDESEWNFYKRLNPKANKEDYIKFLKAEKRR